MVNDRQDHIDRFRDEHVDDLDRFEDWFRLQFPLRNNETLPDLPQRWLEILHYAITQEHITAGWYEAWEQFLEEQGSIDYDGPTEPEDDPREER